MRRPVAHTPMWVAWKEEQGRRARASLHGGGEPKRKKETPECEPSIVEKEQEARRDKGERTLNSATCSSDRLAAMVVVGWRGWVRRKKIEQGADEE